MAKKKIPKKKVVKEEIAKEVSKKEIIERENKQLFWFFGIIVFIFVLFFGTYFYLQSTKQFSYVGVDWRVEDHGGIKFYHGRFNSFSHPWITYNLYLRNNPKKNKVHSEGEFDFFKRTTFISFSPDIDKCRSDIPVAVVVLSSFLNSAIGVQNITPATTEPSVYYETGRRFADCVTVDGGVIIIEKGEPSVIQSKENPFCYVIKINNCEDILPIEKFIIETIRTHSEE